MTKDKQLWLSANDKWHQVLKVATDKAPLGDPQVSHWLQNCTSTKYVENTVLTYNCFSWIEDIPDDINRFKTKYFYIFSHTHFVSVISKLIVLYFLQAKETKVSVSIKQVRKEFLCHEVGPTENKHNFPLVYVS